MSDATIFSIRNQQQSRALIFIHGFSGAADATFGMLPAFVAGNPNLYEWDIYCFGYPTSLSPDVSGVWSADPELDTLAGYLATQIQTTRFARYHELALVAHSMGGLIVQRAVLDSADVADRVRHMLLFGTPSNGLRKAGWGKLFKRQVRDMEAGGEFITRLRKDWQNSFGNGRPFFFRVVAGIRDEFVPRESSVEPFPADLRAFAEGNHVEMVKPATVESDASRLLFTWLSPSATRELVLPSGVTGELAFPTAATGKLAAAVTRGGGVEQLSKMTELEIRQAAFDYEAQGAQDQAIAMLEQVYQRSSDLTGMLAGRLKRRWLADPDTRKAEGERAAELYFEAYNRAHKANDHTQASYNGINYAFMTLALHENKQRTAEIAAAVLTHCNASTDDKWKLATMGEAYLYQGQTDHAVASYRAALTQAWTARERDSMQKQAIWASRLLEDEIAEARVELLFRKA